MDTLVVFYTLIFASAFMSLTSIGLRATYRLIAGDVRRRPRASASARGIDPFEPADTTFMHFDPRMARSAG